ncbi:hypothetical protein C5S53_14950 [Methanophagales archaeon]|nr:hypothetical protein C5S53_14950 [Methanophagales archaeon]
MHKLCRIDIGRGNEIVADFKARFHKRKKRKVFILLMSRNE